MKLMIQNFSLICWIGFAAALSVLPGCASRHPHEQRTDQFLDDKVTAERVQAALADNATYHFPRVRVTATNGTVILSGSVENQPQQRQATALALSIHRVKKVEDHIQLERPPPSP